MRIKQDSKFENRYSRLSNATMAARLFVSARWVGWWTGKGDFSFSRERRNVNNRRVTPLSTFVDCKREFNLLIFNFAVHVISELQFKALTLALTRYMCTLQNNHFYIYKWHFREWQLPCVYLYPYSQLNLNEGALPRKNKHTTDGTDNEQISIGQPYPN